MSEKPLRLLCALLALALTLASSGPWRARAEQAETEVYVYTYSLKIYESPSKKSNVIDVVPFAAPIARLGEKKGWAKVRTDDGGEGYCNAKHLTEKNPNTLSDTVYSQQNHAPVYQRPSVDAPLAGHLNRNEKAKLVAMTPMGDWLRILRDDHYGYIQRPRVDYEKYAEGRTAWIVSNGTKICYDPEIDSDFATAPRGQTVTLLSVIGSWAKIRSDSGLIGYCAASAVSTDQPEE